MESLHQFQIHYLHVELNCVLLTLTSRCFNSQKRRVFLKLAVVFRGVTENLEVVALAVIGFPFDGLPFSLEEFLHQVRLDHFARIVMLSTICRFQALYCQAE